MNEETSKNVSHSVRQRLLNLSKQQRIDFGVMLSNYALERFPYRLSCSKHRNRFVLKGAMLFRIWSEEPHRATRDLDLLAFGYPPIETISQLFQEICGVSVEDDGVEFLVGSIRVDDIREEQEYGGVRVRFPASIAGARVPLQIDIGFGDAVSPTAQETLYPTILDFPAPAIRSTFIRRATAIPDVVPIALSPEFHEDSLKISQWRAFIGSGNVRLRSLILEEVIDMLSRFLILPMFAASQDCQFSAKWTPPGPWTQ